MNVINKTILVQVFLLCDFLTIVGQVDSDSMLFWDNKRKLNCNDFKGKIIQNEQNYKAKAGTAAEISANGFMESGMLNFRITCIFDKKTSWIIDSLCVKVLAHEQLHFDIAELYSRKIRKGVFDLRKKHQTDIELYDKLIKGLLKERNKMDDQYDKETAHGIYKSKQEAWNKKIARELCKLKAYEVDYSEDLEK